MRGMRVDAEFIPGLIEQYRVVNDAYWINSFRFWNMFVSFMRNRFHVTLTYIVPTSFFDMIDGWKYRRSDG